MWEVLGYDISFQVRLQCVKVLPLFEVSEVQYSCMNESVPLKFCARVTFIVTDSTWF